MTVLVADDVKIKNYAMRVDGRLVSAVTEKQLDPASVASLFTPPGDDWRPRQVKRLTGKVSWTLGPGEHTVEVTATDMIDQEGTPEVWAFRVGYGLIAADPIGDDHGPGYYTYPTLAAQYPPGAFDIEGFRLYHNERQVSFVVDVKDWYAGGVAPTLASLPLVADVYIDTDQVVGSGATALLPGRNALVRSQDAWEYCLRISREGARLITASGSETSVLATFESGTGALSVTLEGSQLGLTDYRAIGHWGHLVALLGYDGLNTGHVKEVTTLGGAHVCGGGAEGNVDPNIIDLLAPAVLPTVT